MERGLEGIDGSLAVAAGILIRVSFTAAKLDPRPSWNKEEEMSNIIGALNLSCAAAAFGLSSASLAAVLFGCSSRKVPCLLVFSMFFLSCCLGMASAEEPAHMLFITLGVWISAGAAALLALGHLKSAVLAIAHLLVTKAASRRRASDE